jgi:hypothetical protein
MPPGPPGQPPPQPQAQSWPQQGMQQPADRGVDPDGPATDAVSTPTNGSASIAGWTPPPWTAGPDTQAGWSPPPWSPDAAHARPFWRRIPAVWLIVGALVLVGAFAGWYFDEATPVNPDRPATLPDASRAATGEIDKSGNLSVVDLRVGDCFDLKDPSADQIGNVNAVPCTSEHEFEVFYVGAMGKGSYPTDAAGQRRNHGRQVLQIDGAFGTYVDQNCMPAFGAYIGKAWDDTALDIYWVVPTDDAWRSGDRTMQCAAFYPGIYRLTWSLRGTRQ